MKLKNIYQKKKISYSDLRTLIEAFNYGTATPVCALISYLKELYLIISNNEKVIINTNDGIFKEINKNNFSDFVLQYFDQYILYQKNNRYIFLTDISVQHIL